MNIYFEKKIFFFLNLIISCVFSCPGHLNYDLLRFSSTRLESVLLMLMHFLLLIMEIIGTFINSLYDCFLVC